MPDLALFERVRMFKNRRSALVLRDFGFDTRH